jgi:hypothetical protein
MSHPLCSQGKEFFRKRYVRFSEFVKGIYHSLQVALYLIPQDTNLARRIILSRLPNAVCYAML